MPCDTWKEKPHLIRQKFELCTVLLGHCTRQPAVQHLQSKSVWCIAVSLKTEELTDTPILVSEPCLSYDSRQIPGCHELA